MNPGAIVLDVPDLADADIRLRPWRLEDAPALVAAWHDPAVLAGAHPPEDRSERGARRWIEGWEVRRAGGIAFDLVVADLADDSVVGEIGLSRFDPGRRAAMAGWWIAESARGRGLAAAAVRLMTDWAMAPGRLAAVLASIDVDNVASARVAERAGFVVLRPGGEGEPAVWVRR